MLFAFASVKADNKIGDRGTKWLTQGLEKNSTVTSINLKSESFQCNTQELLPPTHERGNTLPMTHPQPQPPTLLTISTLLLILYRCSFTTHTPTPQRAANFSRPCLLFKDTVYSSLCFFPLAGPQLAVNKHRMRYN